MGLECVCGVCGGGAEVVIENEILYLGLVLVCGKYDNGIAFICSCYHGFVFAQFVLDGSYHFSLWVCFVVGVVLVEFVYAVCCEFPVYFSFICRE